jgi:hypothetical protein
MSKKDVPAIVSAMGVFTEIISSLSKLVAKFGGTMENIYRLATPEGGETLEKIARLIVESCESARRWREENGVICFSVTSDGTTGLEWINRLGAKGFRISDYAKSILLSPDFKPTIGVTTKIAVLKGEMFSDENRLTKNVRAEADKRKLVKPNAEVACLIREKFTDKEIEAMGLWYIVAMHEPIKDSDGGSSLLNAHRDDDGSWLDTSYGRPARRWDRESGFAFAVSQV